MDNEKTLEEEINELAQTGEGCEFDPTLVSAESLAQLTKGHELKYVENIMEVEEEKKLALDNLDDFLEFSEEIQAKAIKAYKSAKYDPEYFSREGSDQELYKPVAILANIDNKKNEAKIKTWKVQYHARIIEKLSALRQYSGVKEGGVFSKIFN